MALARFPKQFIEKHFPLDTKMLDLINSLGMPIAVNGEEVEVEVFPNRPEMFSYTHFVNMVKVYLGKEKPVTYQIQKPGKDHIVTFHDSVKDVRPYAAYAIVKNLSLDEQKIKQLIHLQEKIAITTGRNREKLGVGIFPLDKITFPLQYTALDPKEIKFIPLGETKKMDANAILKNHPMGKEYAWILEKKDKYPVLMDAKAQILTMPPITNSEETGRVTPHTKEVLIECSGTDQFLVKKIVNIFVSMLADMGGTIQAITHKQTKTEVFPDLKPEKKKITLESIKAVLGIQITEKDLTRLLTKMGYGYDGKSNALVPAYRTDVLHEVDIIEDVAIAYGYSNITPEIPQVATIGAVDPKSPIKNKIIETLIGLQALEISTHHFIKSDEVEKMAFDKALTLESSKTDYKFLRPDLLTSLLRIMSENKDRDYPQKMFELGTVFASDQNAQTGVRETEKLSIGLTPANFTDIKQHVQMLLNAFGLTIQSVEKTKKFLIEGRTAAILVEGKEIGYLGEVHPNTLKEWGIKMPLAVAEINLEEFYKLIH